MLTFKDPNRISVLPKVWTAPNNRRIEWRSDRQPFDAFFASLVEYYTANNLGAPDRAVVIDTFCKQMPKWVCSGTDYHTAPSQVASTPRGGGCRSCGKRS